MVTKKYFFVIILIFLVSACTTATKMRAGDPKGSAPKQVQPVAQTVQEEDPVSLPALLIHKTFSGTDFTIGKILAQNESYTRYYITYKSGSLKISGIMNVPKGKGPFPLLILNHGHIDTAVYTNGRGLKREQDYLARHGYVVVHPDFRNHADSDKDPDSELSLRYDYTEDSINAVLAVKAAKLPYIDTDNIGMLGHSMGGGITMNILVSQPNLVKAAVLFAPVSSDYRDNFNKWTKPETPIAKKIIDLYGTPVENPEFWKNISAVTFFKNITAPIMIHQGTADKDVSIAWTDKTVAALKDNGKNVTYYTYQGEPHEFINAWPTVMKRTVDFFDKYLKAVAAH